MHRINVLSFGSKNFNTSLEELKDYLNFKLTTINENGELNSLVSYDVLFCHEDFYNNKPFMEMLQKSDKIKILACSSDKPKLDFFDHKIVLPAKFEDINNLIENSVIKKNFSKNSSIKIKDYTLDKNEKKLLKNKEDYILLTEKEIQLLELLLISNKPISKNRILGDVWKYSEDADTHTVETHIYRLRKKIKSKFLDDNFILNNKSGYLL